MRDWSKYPKWLQVEAQEVYRAQRRAQWEDTAIMVAAFAVMLLGMLLMLHLAELI